MRLEGVSLRDAIDAAVEEETVYMLIQLTPDLTVMDLYGADGYVVMREEDPQDLEEKFREILDSVDEQKPMPTKKVPVKKESKTLSGKKDTYKLDKGKICALFKAGWSPTKIADEMSCTTSAVTYHLKKEGLL